MNRTCHPSILRAYDVRGIFGKTMFVEDAYALARAFAANTDSAEVAVAYDVRLSSPALEEAACRGLLESGCRVLRLGMGPTPMLYHNASEIAGIMITASHNPREYNGMKFVHKSRPLTEAEIQDLGKTTARGEYKSGRGTIENIKGCERYVEYLTPFIRNRPLKVAWDFANAATTTIAPQLLKRIPGEHFVIGGEADGNFPLHHPDPCKPENMRHLQEEVRKHGCDLGLAFDGDGDRLGVVDDRGEILNPQELAALLTRQVLEQNPGSRIILDVKAGIVARGEVTRLGGELLVSPVGHSIIKARLLESRASFAAEMSGHLFFADEHPGYDDAIYAGLRLLRLFKGEEKLSKMREKMPKTCLLEEDLPCPEEEKTPRLAALKAALKADGIKAETMDGFRVEEEEGWWLIRASNTEPKLMAVVEAREKSAAETLRKRISHYVRIVAEGIG